MKGLGQVLKSFRDRSSDFPVYDRTSGTDAFLHTLGPLETPQQGSRAGLHVDVPDADIETGMQDTKRTYDVGVTPIIGKTSSG